MREGEKELETKLLALQMWRPSLAMLTAVVIDFQRATRAGEEREGREIGEERGGVVSLVSTRANKI